MTDLPDCLATEFRATVAVAKDTNERVAATRDLIVKLAARMRMLIDKLPPADVETLGLRVRVSDARNAHSRF